jgi:hypothetical protein
MATTNKNNFLKTNGKILKFAAEEIVIILFAFFLTLFNAGFDINKMNWVVFTFTDIFNIYCRVVATRYASDMEQEINPDIRKLNTLIGLRKKAIIQERKQEVIIDALNYYNYEKSLEIYLDLITIKNDKLNVEKPKQKKKREKYEEIIRHVCVLLDLLKQRKYEAYDERVQEFHLRSKAREYSNIRYNHLFVGTSRTDKYGQEKVTFNLASSSLKRGVPGWIAITAMSATWACLYGDIHSTADLWFMLGSYGFAIVMGTTWGLNNGKKVIQNDMNAALTARVEVSSIVMENAGCAELIARTIKEEREIEEKRKQRVEAEKDGLKDDSHK